MLWMAYCITVIVVLWRLEGRHDCGCGRARFPYFHREHSPGWLMLTRVVLTWIAALWLIAERPGDYFTGVLWLLLGAFMTRRWWLHEKGKIKRAARARGRVIVDGFGRLRVASAMEGAA